jgi:hypothetical protein
MSLGSHRANLFSRSWVEREIGAQLQSHLVLRIEDSMAVACRRMLRAGTLLCDLATQIWQPNSGEGQGCALTLPAAATCVR